MDVELPGEPLWRLHHVPQGRIGPPLSGIREVGKVLTDLETGTGHILLDHLHEHRLSSFDLVDSVPGEAKATTARRARGIPTVEDIPLALTPLKSRIAHRSSPAELTRLGFQGESHPKVERRLEPVEQVPRGLGRSAGDEQPGFLHSDCFRKRLPHPPLVEGARIEVAVCTNLEKLIQLRLGFRKLCVGGQEARSKKTRHLWTLTANLERFQEPPKTRRVQNFRIEVAMCRIEIVAEGGDKVAALPRFGYLGGIGQRDVLPKLQHADALPPGQEDIEERLVVRTDDDDQPAAGVMLHHFDTPVCDPPITAGGEVLIVRQPAGQARLSKVIAADVVDGGPVHLRESRIDLSLGLPVASRIVPE
jgi:hypothetical protein